MKKNGDILKRSGGKGYTLVELTVFMILVGIIVTGLLSPFFEILLQTTHTQGTNQALSVAVSRMEKILGERAVNGFENLSDPCLSSSVSCPSNGYQVSTQISDGWSGAPNDLNYKTISVTVTGQNRVYLSTVVAKGV